MVNLNDMLVFATVVKQGGFTPAADFYGLPKSNISRKVARLEEYLGVRLLERSTRTQSLTDIGRVYFEHCQRIEEEIHSAGRVVESLNASPEGTLRISAPPVAGQELLGARLAGFRKLFPQVHIDLHLGHRAIEALEDGYDLILWEGDISGSGLEVQRLCSSSPAFYASPEYLESAGEIKQPQDLAGHQCLFMNEGDIPAVWELSSQEGKVKVRINPVFSCDDYQLLKRMAVDAEGIAELPAYLCENEVQSGKLVRVLPQWQTESRDIHMIYPAYKGLAPRLRVFLEYLAALFPGD